MRKNEFIQSFRRLSRGHTNAPKEKEKTMCTRVHSKGTRHMVHRAALAKGLLQKPSHHPGPHISRYTVRTIRGNTGFGPGRGWQKKE